jgi:uncharacterized protein DUF5681
MDQQWKHQRSIAMRFQPGKGGNPAGRPPGALNKKTIAVQAVMEERATEMATNLLDRAKNGEPAAMRLCMEQLAPTGRNRRVAIDLPVIKTPEDAELALTVVTDELAAGNLTISEASALVGLIDRMLRVAEQMWNFARARRYGAARDAVIFDDEGAPEGAGAAQQTAEKPAAPLYSPVNSGVGAGTDKTSSASAPESGRVAPEAPREDTPLPRAA